LNEWIRLPEEIETHYHARRTSKPETPHVSDQDQKHAFEVESDELQPVGPGATSFDSTVLDFGHHAGRSIEELAQTDPEYLRWLARHPSGYRYRAEIARVLESAVPHAGDWEG
jgi:hypothetical protein